MRSRLVGIAMQLLIMAILISILLLFIGIGLLILIHACILRRNFRRSSGNDNVTIEAGKNGLSPDDLQKLPCYDYLPKENEENNAAECAVCLEMFRVGEKCRVLTECKHSFHAICVDSWLLRTAVCPTCRTSANKSSDR